MIAHARHRLNGFHRPQEASSLSDTFDGLRNDYDAARTSRYRRKRTGLAPMGGGADYHVRSEAKYLEMMEQARDMDRNDVIVGQTIDRAVDNIIQDGFTLDTKTGDKTLDLDLWERWNAWSIDPESCDTAGELCFYDMEQLVTRQTYVDGDIMALPTRDGSLQLIEGHRLRTPTNTKRNVVLGVLLDERRRRLEYWFTKDEIDPLKAVNRVSDIAPYAARDAEGNRQVFQVYNPKRASQTRGITALAPIFNACGMFEDINFAKMVQQQVVSCFAIFRMVAAGQSGLPSVDTQYGSRSTETQSDGTTRTIEGIAPGMEIQGRPGETLQGFSPAVPNAEFFQHVRLILTLIGINLGLPLVLVLMDGSETNFSGWRGAVDEARKGFRRNQRWLMRRFHSQVYKWKVREWLADDAALRSAANRAGINIFGHRWNPPTWPYIEPMNDAAADLLRDRNGLISKRRLHAERGRDWEELAVEIVEDNAYAIERAKERAKKINEAHDDDQPVHWRELLSLPTPDGVTVSLAPKSEQAPAQMPPGKKPQEAAK